MSDRERLYHRINVIFIPITAVLGLLLLASSGTSQPVESGSYYTPSVTSNLVMAFLYLIVIVFGLGVLWVIISGLINKNVRNMVVVGIKSLIKFFVGIIAATGWLTCILGPLDLVLALLVLGGIATILFLFWEVGAVVLAIYLVITSAKALRENKSVFF